MIEQLLDDHHLNQEKIYSLVEDLSLSGADYADLYFQHSVAESWFLEESIVKSGTYHISHGVGARAVSGEQTGFSYSDDLNIEAISQAIAQKHDENLNFFSVTLGSGIAKAKNTNLSISARNC